MKRFQDWYGRIVLALLMLLMIIPNAAAQEEVWIFGTLCTIIMVVMVGWLVVLVWIYRDAESRGKSGVLWVIVVLLAFIPGLIVWFLVRPPKLGEGGYYYYPPPPPPPGAWYYPPPGSYPPPPPPPRHYPPRKL